MLIQEDTGNQAAAVEWDFRLSKKIVCVFLEEELSMNSLLSASDSVSSGALAQKQFSYFRTSNSQASTRKLHQ